MLISGLPSPQEYEFVAKTSKPPSPVHPPADPARARAGSAPNRATKVSSSTPNVDSSPPKTLHSGRSAKHAPPPSSKVTSKIAKTAKESSTSVSPTSPKPPKSSIAAVSPEGPAGGRKATAPLKDVRLKDVPLKGLLSSDSSADSKTTAPQAVKKPAADVAKAPASQKSAPAAKGSATKSGTSAATSPQPSPPASNSATKPSTGSAVTKTVAVKPVAVKPVAAAKGVKAPVDPDDPFDGLDDLTEKQFLVGQRRLLEQERATYVNQARMLRAEADQLAEDMEPGDVQFDDESGEGAGVSVERERDLAMSAQANVYVEEIDRAMARIDNKTYGICDGCHTPISRPRLRAMPFATQCVSCKNGGLTRR